MAHETRQFNFANNARSTLAVSLSSSETQLVVQAGHGGRFPSIDPTYDEIFSCILFSSDLSNYEIVYVTSKGGDVFTIERAKEGTIARDFPSGVVIVHNVTAAFFEQLISTPPTTPVLTLVSATTTSASLSWTASLPVDVTTVITGYEIYRRTDSGAAVLITSVDESTLSYTDPTIDRLVHSYEYYVRATVASGRRSDASNVVSVVSLSPVALVLQNGSTVLRSTTLDAWTAVAIGGSANWTGGAYAPSLGRIVIVNQAHATHRSAYSDDGGLTWTLHNGLPLFAYRAIAWSEPLGLFCAVADVSGGVARIYTSSDGLTWALTNTGARAMTYPSVVWFEPAQLFVAAGNAGVFDHDGGLSSPDGLNWTVRTINDGGWGHVDRLYTNGVRVFGFGASSNTINYTTNGTTWTGGNGPLSTSNGLAVPPAEDVFVRVRSGSNAVHYSLTSLEAGQVLVDQGQVYSDVRYDEVFGRFVGAGNNEVAVSSDGITWAAQTVVLANSGKIVFALYEP